MTSGAKLSRPELWARIESHALPFGPVLDSGVHPPRVCAAFADELRKAGDWTDESAARLVTEYRRYLYLARVAGETVAPPPLLEGIFLQLLGLGDMYSLNFAPRIPRGLAATSRLTKKQRLPYYRVALQRYERELGETPPGDIWVSEHAFVWNDFWGVVCLIAYFCTWMPLIVVVLLKSLFALLGATISGPLGQIAREVDAGDRFGNVGHYVAGIILPCFLVVVFAVLMIAKGPKTVSRG